MYVHPEEWSIWYLNGEVMIAGWRDQQLPVAPAKPQDSFSGLKEDFVRAAFGPEADRIPPPTVGQLQPDPEATIPPRTSWDNFLSAQPLVPLEAAHTNQYLLLGNVATNMGVNRILFTNEVAQRASEIAIHATPEWRALPATLHVEVWVRGTNPNLARVQVWYRDDSVAALAVLATRTARKGIALHPDDPVCYFELARAYDDFAKGSQLQSTEKMVALRQGLARLTPDLMKDNWVIEQVYGAYPQLFQLYYSSGHFDLAVESLQKSVELLKRSPPPNRTAEELEQMLKSLQQQAQQYETQLQTLSNRFESDARNQPVSRRADIAQRYGLTKEVVRLLEAEASAERLNPADGLRLAKIYLELGQVEQAWETLRQIEEKIGVEKLEPPHQAFFRYLKIGIATARGDFPEAIKEVDRFLANQERLGEQLQWTAKIISALAAGYSYDLINQNPFVRWQSLMYAGKLLADAAGYYEQMASGYALLAILELEYGENEGARKHFELAVRQGAPFEGRREAQRYSELLQKALPKTASASASPTAP
jgi:tetratricopeptide (TPR) repeat protein